jgi:uncharacterized protein (TIGR02246 family)
MATQRPTLSADPDRLRAAHDAVDEFVAGLQAGIDSADAETYNADFGDDVAWGSPYGATVVGYDALHSIHRQMFGRGVAATGPSSRYETVHVMAPAPDVAVAQVRRAALNADGEPIPVDDASAFSEMALYVLVRRDGKWWLAAGQNTPIRPKP